MTLDAMKQNNPLKIGNQTVKALSFNVIGKTSQCALSEKSLF